MKQCILLAQSQSDIESLLPAARVLILESYQAVWLLYSPAVLVDTKAAEAEHQKNIDGLNAAIARCAAAEDFEGAKAYKIQRDAALLDRVTKVKDAWKAIAPFEQNEAEKRLFQPFMDALPGIGVRVQRLPDHYEPSQFIDALNSIRKGWHAPCVPPSFTLTWVSTLANSDGRRTLVVENARPPHPADVAAEAAKQAARVVVVPLTTPDEKSGKSGNPMYNDKRYKELRDMTPDQIFAIGSKIGVPPAELKGTIGKIRAAVWKHEKTKVKAGADVSTEVAAY